MFGPLFFLSGLKPTLWNVWIRKESENKENKRKAGEGKESERKVR